MSRTHFCRARTTPDDFARVVLSYRTNPHLDQRGRGVEAAQLLARTLRGEIRPTTALAAPPLVVNVERQLTREPPCKLLMDAADEIRRRNGVLAASVNLGFPYADVAEMGSSFIVVTDNDVTAARQLANELSSIAWEMRTSLHPQLISVDEALAKVRATVPSRRPVCLLDMGDNVGGGSAGDSTFLAQALSETDALRAFVCICDPRIAAEARATGIGARVQLCVGGKTDARHGTPLPVKVVVRSLHTGRFSEAAARHGGRTEYDMGQPQ